MKSTLGHFGIKKIFKCSSWALLAGTALAGFSAHAQRRHNPSRQIERIAQDLEAQSTYILRMARTEADRSWSRDRWASNEAVRELTNMDRASTDLVRALRAFSPYSRLTMNRLMDFENAFYRADHAVTRAPFSMRLEREMDRLEDDLEDLIYHFEREGFRRDRRPDYHRDRERERRRPDYREPTPPRRPNPGRPDPSRPPRAPEMNDREVRNILNGIYQECLGRNVDTSGFNTYAPRIRQGQQAAVRRDVCNSSEARDRNFEQVLESIYRQCLGRSPDASGKATYMPMLRRGQESQVRRAVCESEEARRRRGGRR